MTTYATHLATDCLNRAAESTGTEQLRDLGAALANIHEEIRRSVHSLRESGASWTQIGDALGVTRQAAQQRYGGMMANVR